METSRSRPSTGFTWLFLVVLSPGAALIVFWFALGQHDRPNGDPVIARVLLAASILLVPVAAIGFSAARWPHAARGGRVALVAASVTGMAVAYVVGFLEVVVTWLSAMDT